MVVELYNIQSIRKATYDIAEQGITQIIGDNSNGKSILIKAMAFVANTSIKDKDERESIINDNSSTGIIVMKRDGMTLKVTISRVRENCQYEFTRRNGDIITRTIREGGLEILAEEFGWIAFEGNICLQIFETFGIMPFVNNRPASDYEIVDYIITDKVANNFVETYEKVTYPAFKQYVADLNSKISSSQRVLDGITFYDIPKHEDMLYKLRAYYRNVAHLVYYMPERLPIYKTVPMIEVTPYTPSMLPVYKLLKPIEPLVDLTDVVREYHLTLNGVCPTCGTVVKDMEVHTHAV